MRIVSLLSSATEIVYALGLEDRLVAISHECDWPPEALRLPRASRSRFDPAGLTSGEIDAEVRRCMVEHGSVYEVDAALLGQLRPDLVLTQGVCEVCAVPTGSVEEAVAGLADPPRVLSLDAHTLAEILGTVRQVAEAAGEAARGEEVARVLRDRVDRIGERLEGRERPRALALEWLDPPFAPGHWVPEMVELAGGANLSGTAGSHSRQMEWAEVEGMDPDRLLLAPCGYALERAREDADEQGERLRALAPRAVGSGGAWVLHSSYVSRSGPRVVEGIEAMAHALHPELFPAAWAEGRAERWR